MASMTPSGMTKYQHVANELRKRINRGAIAPGDPFPTEVELEKEFGYTRGTIRQAISVLRQEGAIEVIHGRGTFVRKRRLIRRDIAAGLQREHASRRGVVPEKDLFAALTGTPGDIHVKTSYDTVGADDAMAELLDVTVGTQLLRRTYLYTVDGSPHQVAYSHLPYDMVSGTPLTDPANERPGRGTMAQLYDLGIEVDHVDVMYRARLATPEEAAILAIAPGMAVFASKRVMYAAGRAVEAGTGIVPGDILELLISVDFKADK